MASSDDDVEALPEFVSDYSFVDDQDAPVPFSILPVKWSSDDSTASSRKQIFLEGRTDDGLQKIYKPVKAWKFYLTGQKPEISVLLRDNNWIKLQKPRKIYEPTIRTILITVHCLHVARRNHDISAKSLWDQLARTFSLYEVKPSVNDLIDHVALIEEVVKKDEYLAKSKVLASFLREKPRKKAIDEDALISEKFFVDDAVEDMVDGAEETDDDADEDGFVGEYDTVCAICDDGGNLLCCDGVCMRSFHASPEADGAEAAGCDTLDLPESEVEAPTFLCKNCQYKRHQCSVCGQLGSSDKSSGAEVFICAAATCGHFYHPQCVAKCLHRGNKAAAEEMQKEIVAGEAFTCPVHRCHICKGLENKEDPELQFAICRRCPKSYHRKCLPREISFEDEEVEGLIQRAWTDLLPNRILIYCMEHQIDDDLGTPLRDHLKFPYVEDRKAKRSSSLLIEDTTGFRKKTLSSLGSAKEITTSKSGKQIKKSLRADADSLTPKLNKLKRVGSPRKSLTPKMPPKKVDKPTAAEEGKTSLGFRSSNSQQSDSVKPSKGLREVDSIRTVKTTNKVPQLDSDSEKRILELMTEATTSITLDDVFKKHNKLASTHAHSMKISIDRSITQGKVEGFVGAVRTALKKLENGGTIDDARALCGPNVLNQIIKWQSKLRVHISPFLYGMRYTSFGRHFTKVDKLKEIVNKIHYYVEGGDTIVDFCCGANDFSSLMKEKLDQTGKKCYYRNFDLFPPKNDFCFQKRDWMSVQPNELPKGSQLVMGLNPPFGVKARLANQFIDKALEFKPKLLILIVPPETERLDKKEKLPYDLVWEDDQKLSGKSFYLPGSVDVNDKQMEDWNMVAPVLYLWSHPDWTSKHMVIAKKLGHLFSEKHKEPMSNSSKEVQVPEYLAETHAEDVPMEIDETPEDGKGEERKETRAVGTEDQKEGSLNQNDNKEGNHGSGSHGKKESNRARKRRRAVEMNSRGRDGISPKDVNSRARDGISPKDKRRPPPNERYHGRPAARSLSDRHPIRETPLDRDVGDAGNHGHFRPSFPSPPPMLYGSGDRGTPSGYSDDVVRKYTRKDEEPYPGAGHRWPVDVSPGPPEYGTRNLDEWSGEIGGFAHRSYPGEIPYRPPFPAEPTYGRPNMSAMERYAPRLDELNRGRMGSMGSDVLGVNRSGMYDPRPPPGPGYGGYTSAFAPGSEYPYPHNNSGGWIMD